MTAHVSDAKKKVVKDVVDLISKYNIIGAVDMENLPAPQLQKMREQLRDRLTLFMTKRRLFKIAIEQAKDKKKGIEQLLPHLKGMPALIFTNENPFKLYKTLQKSKSPAPAKAGQTSPKDIVIPAGPTSFMPGPIIGELGALGIKCGVEGGKVAVKEDSTVVREGEVIKQKVAELLVRFNIMPMEVGLNITATYENGIIFGKDVLAIDEDKFNADLGNAGRWAFNLAIYMGYATKDTIEPLIAKAFREAKAIGLSQNIIDDKIIDDLLAKAERGMLGLKSTANIETVEKAAPKAEEKAPEPKPEEKPAEAPKSEPKVEEKKQEVIKEMKEEAKEIKKDIDELAKKVEEKQPEKKEEVKEVAEELKKEVDAEEKQAVKEIEVDAKIAQKVEERKPEPPKPLEGEAKAEEAKKEEKKEEDMKTDHGSKILTEDEKVEEEILEEEKNKEPSLKEAETKDEEEEKLAAEKSVEVRPETAPMPKPEKPDIQGTVFPKKEEEIKQLKADAEAAVKEIEKEAKIEEKKQPEKKEEIEKAAKILEKEVEKQEKKVEEELKTEDKTAKMVDQIKKHAKGTEPTADSLLKEVETAPKPEPEPKPEPKRESVPTIEELRKGQKKAPDLGVSDVQGLSTKETQKTSGDVPSIQELAKQREKKEAKDVENLAKDLVKKGTLRR